MPRDFFFGMIRVPMWDYYWGFTAAQIELLTIDQPIIVYKRDENTARPGERGYKGMSEKESRELVKNFKKRKIVEKMNYGKVKKYDMGTLLEKGKLKSEKK